MVFLVLFLLGVGLVYGQVAGGAGVEAAFLALAGAEEAGGEVSGRCVAFKSTLNSFSGGL